MTGGRSIHGIRTWLYVPADQRSKLDKAMNSGADAVLADLEDAVPPDRRAHATVDLSAWLNGQSSSAHRPPIWVRLDSTPDDAQIALARHPMIEGICLPKAEDPATVAALCDALQHRALMLLVETGRGVLRSWELASAADGVAVLQLGEQDLRADLGMPPPGVVGIAADPEPLRAARAAVVLASAAAGLVAPVAPVSVVIDEAEQLTADTARLRLDGFGSRAVIHPRQIAPVLAGLTPSQEEIRWAHAVIDGDRKAAADGRGVSVVDGRMVDTPVVTQARAVLQRLGSPEVQGGSSEPAP
jgi:citrate lyase subunit beta/citryl-CoA lyase